MDGPPGPDRLSLMLNAEISAVITAMRQNAKWAVVPRGYNVSSGLVGMGDRVADRPGPRVCLHGRQNAQPICEVLSRSRVCWGCHSLCRRRTIWSLSPTTRIFVLWGARSSNGKVRRSFEACAAGLGQPGAGGAAVQQRTMETQRCNRCFWRNRPRSLSGADLPLFISVGRRCSCICMHCSLHKQLLAHQRLNLPTAANIGPRATPPVPLLTPHPNRLVGCPPTPVPLPLPQASQGARR